MYVISVCDAYFGSYRPFLGSNFGDQNFNFFKYGHVIYHSTRLNKYFQNMYEFSVCDAYLGTYSLF